MESVFYSIGTLCLLSIFALGRQSAGASEQAASYAQAVGRLLLTAKHLAGFVFGVMAFCIGAGLYYVVFYRSGLVPRWLSAWGLIALVLLFSAVPCLLIENPLSLWQFGLWLPRINTRKWSYGLLILKVQCICNRFAARVSPGGAILKQTLGKKSAATIDGSCRQHLRVTGCASPESGNART
jgi:hypothetical protein